jgi:multidrug efflux pump subunit AcrA (membrane-fusion protein)
VRTEGEIDPDSRMIHVVARVDDPYGRAAPTAGPPLAVGMFVSASIHGRELPRAVVLPRAALRTHDRVWVVGADGRLRERPVTVVRADRETVVVAAGLAAGDRVCLSTVEGFVDGMVVRTTEPT